MTATTSTDWTASGIAAGVRSRRRSAVDTVREALDRLEARDGDIGAFQVVRREAALRQAASVDGRQLIAALDSCQHFAEESRRTRCETIARKTNGQATQLSGNFEGGYSVSGAPAGRQDN